MSKSTKQETLNKNDKDSTVSTMRNENDCGNRIHFIISETKWNESQNAMKTLFEIAQNGTANDDKEKMMKQLNIINNNIFCVNNNNISNEKSSLINKTRSSNNSDQSVQGPKMKEQVSSPGFDDSDENIENEDIKQLVTKYHLYKKNQSIREQTSLKQVSPNGAPYDSVDSFAFIPDNIPIVLIMGEMGTGKSSLCNKMAGIYYKIVEKKTVVSKSSEANDKENENDSEEEASYMASDDEEEDKNVKIEYEINAEGQNELFKSGDKETSETQNTSWANVEFLGDKEQRLIILDTPGLNEHKKLAKHHREDLKSKLAAIHRIDAILIVFDKAGRFKKAHAEMLDDIASLFATNENFYDHFGIAVTHCDEKDTQWQIGHKKRLKNFQNVISSHFFGKNEECKEDNNSKRKIPIFTFSNIQDSKRFGKEGIRRWSHHKEFERFYKEFCVESHKNTLVSGDYYLMQKMDNAIEKLEKESYMTSASALHYLIGEMVAERRRLDAIYEKNARYLQRRPKNAMEGFDVFTKSIVTTVRQFTVFADDDDNDKEDESKYNNSDDNNDTTKAGQSGGGGWASWLVSAVTKRVSQGIGLGATGAAGLIDGVSASVKQENRDEMIKQQKKQYEKMRKSLISNILDDKKIKLKEMSLVDEMYDRYLDLNDKETIKAINEIAKAAVNDDQDCPKSN